MTNPRLLLLKFGLMKNGCICNGAAVLFGNDFADSVEISNPGAFPPDFPLEMPETSDDSFPHNPVMARVLYLRKTIETWGRGINLIFSSCRDEGRLPPSVTERNGFVKVVFPRVNPSLRKGADLTAKSPNKNAAKSPNKTRGKKRAIKALSEILPMGMRADARRSLLAVFNEVYSNSDVTIKQVEERTSLSNGVVKDALAMLKEMGAIFRVGAKKNGYWLISNRLTGEAEGGEGSVVKG